MDLQHLPESVSARYLAPGVRFVPLDGDQPAVVVAAVGRGDSAHMPTIAFLRTISKAVKACTLKPRRRRSAPPPE